MTVDDKVSLAPDLYLNLSATLNVLQQDVLNPHIWFYSLMTASDSGYIHTATQYSCQSCIKIEEKESITIK